MVTKTALLVEVAANYADNTSENITPAIVRQTSVDSINSWQQAPQVNAQTGTSYTISVDDYGKMVLFANASPVAVTLPAATATAFFPFNVLVKNNGAGTVTVTPVSGTIEGAGTATVPTGSSAWLVSDGTNWRIGFLASAGGALFTATTPGSVPAPGAGVTTTFLRADGTWIAPAGAGNIVGSAPSVVGHLATWNNLTATALVDVNDWGISTHALVPVNDNAADVGTAALRVRAIYGVTHNIMGATSGQIGFNAPAAVTSYTLTWPAAVPGASSGMLVSTGGAVSFSANLGVLGAATTLDSVFYRSHTGVATPVALGAVGTALVSTGATTAPTMQAVVQPAVSTNLSVGYTATSFAEGPVSGTTYTPAPASGNFQHYTNTGAHTLAPPLSTCTMVIDMVNGSTPGSVTTTGFTKVDGDALDVTSGHIFRFYISVNVLSGGGSHLNIKRMV